MTSTPETLINVETRISICINNLPLVSYAFSGNFLQLTPRTPNIFFSLHLKMVFKGMASAILATQFSLVSPMYTEGIHVSKLLFCFSLVNLSFIIGTSRPRSQKRRGKIIFPSLQSNRLHHIVQMCSRPYHLGLHNCTLRLHSMMFALPGKSEHISVVRQCMTVLLHQYQ